jgi:ribonucleoside-diphosphate reductase alpha chain
MGVWDAMCRTIMSAGSRRGAMMATLSCDHPDIELFIDAKRTPGQLAMFNLSVLASDAFMEAVANDREWHLQFGGKVYRSLPARALWNRIMRANYDYAEPGVIFVDRVNRQNNLRYCETIRATNPCGEQPLPPYGACLLGSINLAKLVRNPFSAEARLDEAELARLTRIALRLLDNVIDISRFPLPEQRAEAQTKRRIGLGVTGLADALIFCRARYGAAESLALIDRWLNVLSHAAYEASAEIAKEKGPFPLFDRNAYLAAPHVAALPQPIRDAIAACGIRNALLTSIAPTGTISLLADNVSSGVEPVFSYSYTRRVLMPDGTSREEAVTDYAWRTFRAMFGEDAALPDYFVTAQTLSPGDHLAVQATAQKHIDSSISKTINLPSTISFEDFQDVYVKAYETGCKGCTTYRPNEVRGAVLDVSSAPAKDVSASQGPKEPELPLPVPIAAAGHAFEESGGVVYMTKPLDRPEVLLGQTYKIKWPDSDHAFYITINDIEADGRRRPFEVFINSKNMEAYAWTLALTRMISAVFRRGGDVSFVVHELKAVFDPRGGQWMGGQYVPSLLAAIGDVIERHLVATGFMPPREILAEQPAQAAAIGAGEIRGRSCPRCGSPALIRQENCDNCIACGYSRCA